jgi:hypothetical protein
VSHRDDLDAKSNVDKSQSVETQMLLSFLKLYSHLSSLHMKCLVLTTPTNKTYNYEFQYVSNSKFPSRAFLRME